LVLSVLARDGITGRIRWRARLATNGDSFPGVESWDQVIEKALLDPPVPALPRDLQHLHLLLLHLAHPHTSTSNPPKPLLGLLNTSLTQASWARLQKRVRDCVRLPGI